MKGGKPDVAAWRVRVVRVRAGELWRMARVWGPRWRMLVPDMVVIGGEVVELESDGEVNGWWERLERLDLGERCPIIA